LCACTTAPPRTKTHTQHRLPPLYDILTSGWSLGQGRGWIAQSNPVGAELCHGRHQCQLTAIFLFHPPLFLVSVRARLGLPLALGMILPRVVVSPEQNMTTTVAALTAPCHRAHRTAPPRSWATRLKDSTETLDGLVHLPRV
jgi:hypothetical protein